MTSRCVFTVRVRDVSAGEVLLLHGRNEVSAAERGRGEHQERTADLDLGLYRTGRLHLQADLW